MFEHVLARFGIRWLVSSLGLWIAATLLGSNDRSGVHRGRRASRGDPSGAAGLSRPGWMDGRGPDRMARRLVQGFEWAGCIDGAPTVERPASSADFACPFRFFSRTAAR